ncbi:transposase [uncultured Alloprevotella sp.]|uniref:transposase n=2 Tax=Alloprevotella TaxID=1283313 RepID=UPI0025DCCC2A|nr:transposase [uncultured Alloprevotella sp.]
MEIYCIADDFCKEYELELNTKALSLSNPSPNTPKTRNRKGRMSDAEMFTILVLLHSNTFRNFKLSDIGIKTLRSVVLRC